MQSSTQSSVRPFGYLTAYRILREQNHFGVLASVRFALWLAYGNELFPPGEFAAWANDQIERHPFAIGVLMGVWAYALIIFILHMLVPHMCTIR